MPYYQFSNRLFRCLFFNITAALCLFQLSSCNKIKTTATNGVNDIAAPLQSNWNAAAFYNDQIGVIVGGDNFTQTAIIYTIDGGNTWHESQIVNNPGKAIYAITIQNGQFIATGIDGKMYYGLVDRPDSFYSAQSHLWQWNRSLVFHDYGGIIVSGASQSFGYIQHVEHMGGYVSIDTLDFEPRKVALFFNQDTYITGYGAIIKSTDFGKNWTYTNASGDFYTDITYQRSKGTFWACGYNGSLLMSKDNGMHWEKYRNGNQILTNRYRFKSIVAVDDYVFVGGDKGSLLQISDKKITSININTTSDVNFLYPFSQNKLIVGGVDGLLKIVNL